MKILLQIDTIHILKRAQDRVCQLPGLERDCEPPAGESKRSWEESTFQIYAATPGNLQYPFFRAALVVHLPTAPRLSIKSRFSPAQESFILLPSFTSSSRHLEIIHVGIHFLCLSLPDYKSLTASKATTTRPATEQDKPDMDPESEHAARVALAGNSTLNDIIPHWERSMTLNPKDPLEQASTVQQTDYPKYEKMIQHWENFLNANPPPQVHLYWKKGLAEAKQRFTLGPKPTKELRQLVEKATRATEQDLLLIKWFSIASPTDSVLKYDMCVTVPRVLAQLMGMGPPQDDEFSELHPEQGELWEGYFAPKIRQQWPASMSLIYASKLIANFWDVDLEDFNSIADMHLRAKVWYQKMEESLNTDHYADWMKAWKEEFPEVADGFEEEDALRASKVKAEVKAWKETWRARMSVYKGEGEAANREETGQEVSALHAPPDMVPEEPLGGMELSDADWEDAMDMV